MGKEKEDTKAPEKKEGSTIVVKELPKVDARTLTEDNGTLHPILTEEEAIGEILEKVRAIFKAVAK
jgi:hypothetical protein